MKWIERFDLFLLDFDGLLVNTEEIHFQAYRLLCAKHGCTLSWDFKKYVSIAHQKATGLREALLEDFPQLLRAGDWDSLYREKKALYLELLFKSSPTLMPGVESFLEELALLRKKRCVVTHSPKEQVEQIKSAIPALKTIPVWFTREDYDLPKPAPDGYFKAMEVLADPGDQIIGFEDSLKGIRSLQQTSALPILICDPQHPQLTSGAEGVHHFSSFQKIPSTLKPK